VPGGCCDDILCLSISASTRPTMRSRSRSAAGLRSLAELRELAPWPTTSRGWIPGAFVTRFPNPFSECDATLPGDGLGNDPDRVTPQAADQSPDESFIHTADQSARLIGQPLERTASEVNTSMTVVIGLEAQPLQHLGDRCECLLSVLRTGIEPTKLRPAHLEPSLPRGPARRSFPRLTLPLGLEGPKHHGAQEVVAALRDRDVDLTLRRLVALRRAARTTTPAARRSGV
jgi:hypothetical protein